MSVLSTWLHELAATSKKDILTVAAPYVTATVLLATFVVTIRFTKSQKKTDTAVECGRIFSELMKTKWEVKNLPEAVPGVEAGERARQLQDAARHFYGQFFSFQFSEFVAFRSGYIDRKTFSLWMRSRRHEYIAGNRARDPENIHGIRYREGWQHWFDEWHHGTHDKFTDFMRRVHTCPTDACVDDVVGKYAPFVSRTCWFISSLWPFRRQ